MSGESHTSPGPAGPGPAVDARGLPVIDPTVNVLATVDAAVRRQDDLRELEATHVRELLVQKDALRECEAHHVQELMSLRAAFSQEIREAESNRIDAIRAVDVGAVSRAAEVSATQASTLAAQVATSAETLRGQVAAAAIAAQTALAAALEPIQKSIDDLRRAQYEQQGQRVAQTESKDTGQWIVGTIFAAFVALAAVLSLAVYIATHH